MYATNSEFIARLDEKKFIKNFLNSNLSDSGLIHPGVFLIQGPSGSGKSRLIDECLGKLENVVYMRVETPHRLNYNSFRSVLLSSVLSQYRLLLTSELDRNKDDWLWITPKNKNALKNAISSVANGLTYGAITAISSLAKIVTSSKEAHFDEFFLQNTEREELGEVLVGEISTSTPLNIAISNAQELAAKDIEYIFDFAKKAKSIVALEYTTESFQDGIIDREHIASLTVDSSINVSALVLSPLKWNNACTIVSHISANDLWAKNYYERHGFNLFDLKNLTGPESENLKSLTIADMSFGPATIPGLKNRFPATRSKIGTLTKDEKFLVSLLYIHKGFIHEDILISLVPEHLSEAAVKSTLTRLVVDLCLLGKRPDANGKHEYSIIHESVSIAIEDSVELLVIIKLSARQWQKYYFEKVNDRSHRDKLDFSFEDNIRLAYFSALINKNSDLYDSCKEIYRLSQFIRVEGDIEETYREILEEVAQTELIPMQMRSITLYFLSASALNFQNIEIAKEALSYMEQKSFGAIVLSVIIQQLNGQYTKSRDNLHNLINIFDRELDKQDSLNLRLIQIINENNLAKDSKEISEVRKKYRSLFNVSQAHPEICSSILKHASIGFGYEDSINPITESITSLENQENYFEAAQARLIKLMQLTRLGKLDEAYLLFNEIKGFFPRNFIEATNLWNIEAILRCYAEVGITTIKDETIGNPRDLFIRARYNSRDEFRKIVLSSNIFVYDHFINPHLVSEADKKISINMLVDFLESSSIGFKYLYVLGWYNLMKYFEQIGDQETANHYRQKIGSIDSKDSLLWQAALGIIDALGTEVEFLVSTPYMFGFLPNHRVSPPTFGNCVDKISQIISSYRLPIE